MLYTSDAGSGLLSQLAQNSRGVETNRGGSGRWSAGKGAAVAATARRRRPPYADGTTTCQRETSWLSAQCSPRTQSWLAPSPASCAPSLSSLHTTCLTSTAKRAQQQKGRAQMHKTAMQAIATLCTEGREGHSLSEKLGLRSRTGGLKSAGPVSQSRLNRFAPCLCRQIMLSATQVCSSLYVDLWDSISFSRVRCGRWLGRAQVASLQQVDSNAGVPGWDLKHKEETTNARHSWAYPKKDAVPENSKAGNLMWVPNSQVPTEIYFV